MTDRPPADPPSLSDDPRVAPVLDALDRVRRSLPAGEERPGQQVMASLVSEALLDPHHLVVQAGTGTGKSLGYLVPAVMLGRRTVVATATKALQDQLVGRDIPQLAAALGRPLAAAVLKGRSNYLCLQRAAEYRTDTYQGELDGLERRGAAEEIGRLLAWADGSETGDRADLDVEPSDAAWDAVSVGARECPGAARCPAGDRCFAEIARSRAGAADIVVTNTHYYALHLAAEADLIGDHDLLVVDEAHTLEEVVTAVSGVELWAGRIAHAARQFSGVIADPTTLAAIQNAAADLDDALAPHVGQRLDLLPGTVSDALDAIRVHLMEAIAHTRGVPDTAPEEATSRARRATQSLSSVVLDIDGAVDPAPGTVRFVEGTTEAPHLRVAPIEIADLLDERLWNPTPDPDRSGTAPTDPTGAATADPTGAPTADPTGAPTGGIGGTPSGPSTVILTSATIPLRLAERLGLPSSTVEHDVGSPFDHAEQALLYCATALPDPRSEGWEAGVHAELDSLIRAAGGRTLALFTSRRAMNSAHDALAADLPFRVYRQGELPKPALVERFSEDESSCLFATMGFWQGIDVPGSTLSLVTIDRLPFSRPDDPLLMARREAAGRDAFRLIDIPRAAAMLAQGAGRLIRTATDRGVVAVFDRRLATARSYRWDLIGALPPMKRTADRAEVVAYLRSLRDTPPPPGPVADQ